MMANAHVLFFLLLLLVLLPASPVSATVFTYDGKGNAGSIQDLINTTANGDSIYLAGGTYYENLQINRSIVFGALDTNDPPEIVSSRSVRCRDYACFRWHYDKRRDHFRGCRARDFS